MLHTEQAQTHKIYFCTVSCYRRMPLIELGNGYPAIYRWFNILKKYSCDVIAYVIMPNHFHVMLFPASPEYHINYLIGECKRFTAYQIVQGLQRKGDKGLLQKLQRAVPAHERSAKKIHHVFMPSVNWHCCDTTESIIKGVNYIHRNPVQGNWNLVDDFVDYPHSSARFYELNDSEGKKYLVHYDDVSG